MYAGERRPSFSANSLFGENTARAASFELRESEELDFDESRIIDISSPIQSYRDHSRDVIDLSWSSSDFLLSASVDKTVRLWHVSRCVMHVFLFLLVLCGSLLD